MDINMKTKKHTLSLLCVVLLLSKFANAQQLEKKRLFEEHIRSNVASKGEIDVFLNETSWAQFDPEVGYILGNFLPRDGIAGSSTISTVQPNGARTSFLYKNRPCRINTYGNSFTQCHQVSDGETWQEYLAGHLGETIRNFGRGGFGLYQAYRRMLREEQTQDAAEYVMLYIWGDDHIRSLLRCRYMLTTSWNRSQDSKEGAGRMFHGNFWSNIEMDLETGKLVEHPNRIPDSKELYRMTDPDWMWDNLKDDLALQMALYSRGLIDNIDEMKLNLLSQHLDYPLELNQDFVPRETVSALLDAYSFAATKNILLKAKAFTEKHDKKLMILLLDPSRVTPVLLRGGVRYDQEIVDFLKENHFKVFDMNLVHLDDYQSFNLSPVEYFQRYFIGHYNPAGNHLFAYSLRDSVVEWLDPKPVPYLDTDRKIIHFKGYLPEIE